MNLITHQKLIKIGTSIGVTLPAKELKRLGLEPGHEVEITIKPLRTDNDQKIDELIAQYQDFKAKFDQTIKKLK